VFDSTHDARFYNIASLALQPRSPLC